MGQARCPITSIGSRDIFISVRFSKYQNRITKNLNIPVRALRFLRLQLPFLFNHLSNVFSIHYDTNGLPSLNSNLTDFGTVIRAEARILRYGT